MTKITIPDDAETIRQLRAQLAEREAEIADLKTSIVAFGAIHAVNDAKTWGLPDGHIRAHFYDILKTAGARMDDFTRVQP